MSTELTIHDDEKDFKEEILQSIIETVIPMVKPLIKPATHKFKEFMKEDNMLVIQMVKEDVYVFHIKKSEIEKFQLKDGMKAQNVYSVDEFIEGVLSGKFNMG